MPRRQLADWQRNTGHFEEGQTVAGGMYSKDASEIYHDVPYVQKQELEPSEHPGFFRGIRWADSERTDHLRHRPQSSKHNAILDTTRRKRPAKTTY